MEVVHDASLALFQPPVIERQIYETEWSVYPPKNAVAGEKDIEFIIQPLKKKYIDLSRTYIRLDMISTKKNGGPMKGRSFMYTHRVAKCFKKVTLKIGNENIFDGVGENYTAKDDIEQYTMFHSKTDSSQIYPTENIHAEDSEMETLFHHLYTGITKPILNQVPITILIEQSDLERRTGNRFSNADHKIMDASLYVCTINVDPKVIVKHDALLSTKNAVYPYWGVQMKTFEMDTGLQEIVLDDIFDGFVPSRLMVGVMKSAQYTGKNFMFEDVLPAWKQLVPTALRLRELKLTINGRSMMVDDYSIYDNIYIPNEEEFFVSDYQRFIRFHCIIPFNIRYLGDTVFEKQKKGNTTLKLKFDAAVTENLVIVLYARFAKKIEIDKVRTVSRQDA